MKGKTSGCEADICCLAYRGGASDASDDFHEPLTNEPSASADSGARQRGGHEFTLENRTAEEKTMNEEMNKQQEAEVKAEAPVETMEDYAAELEASYKAFDERHFELPETDDAEGEKWAEFAQMMADRTVLNVKIAEAVKGGVVAFVNEVRAFIPASQLSTEYVEKLEDWQGKHVDAVIITVDPEKAEYPIKDHTLEQDVRAGQIVYRTDCSGIYEYYKKLTKAQSAPYSGFVNEGSPSLKQKIARFIRGNFFLPDARRGWNKHAYHQAIQIIQEEKIDAVITTGPPMSTHLVGQKLKKRFHLHWIADFRDPWTDIYYYNKMYPTPIAKAIDRK